MSKSNLLVIVNITQDHCTLFSVQQYSTGHVIQFLFFCYLGFKMVIRYRDILEVITVLSNEKELTVTVRLVNTQAIH
jgi:hypothetical protein